MKNTIDLIKNTTVAIALDINVDFEDNYSFYFKGENLSDKNRILKNLYSLSSKISDNEFIGVQVELTGKYRYNLTAYTNSDATEDDLQWAFESVGKSKSHLKLENCGETSDEHYFTYFASLINPDKPNPNSDHESAFFNASEILTEIHGIMDFILFPDKDNNVKGLVLLSAPCRIPLRLSAALPLALPRLSFTRIENCSNLDLSDWIAYSLPADYVLDASCHVFYVLANNDFDYFEDIFLEDQLNDLPDELLSDNTNSKKPDTDDKEPDYVKQLNMLVGLENVKSEISDIIAYARMKKDMLESGMKPSGITLNMEFVGNPGTAKTTVARLLAGILYQIGLIHNPVPFEVGRADLVGKYEGQTADKIKHVFEKASGRLLFIDEAYSLVEEWEGAYGDEAINTIVQEMENHRHETIVIFAGYPDKMKDFISRNPGLRSRVPFRIEFSDYNAEELAQIASLCAKETGFTIDSSAKSKITDICKTVTGNSELGNGRFSRNLIEKAEIAYAKRFYSDNDTVREGNDFVLRADDFTAINYTTKRQPNTIGFQIS